MAYRIGDRFPPPPIAYRLLEPGSYQYECCEITSNKIPFLSNTRRNTQPGNRIWTHTIYDAEQARKIPNCTTFMSKVPRFPYEALSKEDIESILCRCGIENVCECAEEIDKEPEVICQGKIFKKLFKGPPPRSGTEGLSAPSRRDNGFEELPDGTLKRVFKSENNEGPPFYDATVNEATAFYRGWKWSRRTSSRAMKALERRPGPADYSLERTPNKEEICAEKIREQKRKNSKQVRYIEMVQQRNLRDKFPGPSDYSPKNAPGTELQHSGAKAARFQDNMRNVSPGPTAHWIRRDFDPAKPPEIPCQARLPEPSCFGVKAQRFKPLKEEGPSPASYSVATKRCNMLNCSKAPFRTTAVRFKENIVEHDEDFSIDEDSDEKTLQICPKHTWQFKSKTVRMPPLQKKQFEQSPADLPMERFSIERLKQLQEISPFISSEGRFQPWHDWLPVFAQLNTPGPGYYCLDKYRCLPAFKIGPLTRCERFPTTGYRTPAPNEYKVGRGIETVLATHNQRLKNNIHNQHKLHWKPNVPSKLTLEEREAAILQKCILELNVDGTDADNAHISKVPSEIEPDACMCHISDPEILKPKLLRCFLYRHPVKPGV